MVCFSWLFESPARGSEGGVESSSVLYLMWSAAIVSLKRSARCPERLENLIRHRCAVRYLITAGGRGPFRGWKNHADASLNFYNAVVFG